MAAQLNRKNLGTFLPLFAISILLGGSLVPMVVEASPNEGNMTGGCFGEECDHKGKYTKGRG